VGKEEGKLGTKGIARTPSKSPVKVSITPSSDNESRESETISEFDQKEGYRRRIRKGNGEKGIVK